MRLNKMYRRNHAADEGQATTILLCCMVVAVLAVTMLLMRIGHANDLRTRARQAADAAALASVSTLRDHAIAMIMNERIAPAYLPIGPDSETAATHYANRNGSIVTGYESGGTSAKVTVRSRECVKKEPGGGKFQAEKPCVRTDTDKDQDKDGERTATATSAATVDLPPCFTSTYPGGGQYVSCNNKDVSTWSWSDLADLFKVHLTDTYNPVIPLMAGAGGSVPHLPPASDPERHHNELQGQKLARDIKHWEGPEWECLDQLWLHESGWDHHADNPTSDAYGIPQSLPGSKMAANGADWATNPDTQIKWGLDYIDDRYGTPCNAWQQWQARNPHWY